MTTNKILLGGITGAVTLFILKWIVYGALLINWVTANLNPCTLRPMNEYVIWAMLLAAFAFGFLISLVFSWSNTTGMLKGAKIAGIMGFLYSISMDLSLYGTSTRFITLSPVFVNVIVNTAMWVVVGVVVGWVMGMGKKEA
jgi:hypothetical protein